MRKFEDGVTKVRLEHITFLVASHFNPNGRETIDQKLRNIILNDSKKMITKPKS